MMLLCAVLAGLLWPVGLYGQTDITFFAIGDTHIGWRSDANPDEGNNLALLAELNALPGTAYPGQIGGIVDVPLGVLHVGDMIDRVFYIGPPDQWNDFVNIYGTDGTDGMLNYPLYQCMGNNDKDADNQSGTTYIRDQVTARHGGLYYSWDWQGVHFVCMDMTPTPEILNWLADDLAATGPVRPIVLFDHFPPSSPGEALRQVIEGYNIVAIFHGHTHAARHTIWEGYDVYECGTPLGGGSRFSVAHITDTYMTVVERTWSNGGSGSWSSYVEHRDLDPVSQYTLNIQVDSAGPQAVTPSAGPHQYYDGTTVQISAGRFVDCPDVYVFDHWEGPVADPNSPTTTVLINTDRTVTAVFTATRQCGDQCHLYLPADLYKDCKVNWADFAVFAERWVLACSLPHWCDGADMNHSGLVDWADFALFVNDWLACTAPECD